MEGRTQDGSLAYYVVGNDGGLDMFRIEGMKRKTAVGLCMFFSGIGVGSLRFPIVGSSTENPVSVDLCFLIRNPDLIGSRRFITTAKIAPAFPHEPGLVSDSCPKRGAGFTEKLDRQDFVAELNRIFENDPYDSVPVIFEGTLYRPSLIRRLWFGIATRFGVHDQTAPITIRRYRAVGKQNGDSKLMELPDSHP
jgi:hypothetical protein